MQAESWLRTLTYKLFVSIKKQKSDLKLCVYTDIFQHMAHVVLNENKKKIDDFEMFNFEPDELVQKNKRKKYTTTACLNNNQ